MTPVPSDPRVTTVTFDPSLGATFSAQLTDPDLPRLDFDSLREWLDLASSQLARATQLETDHAALVADRDSLASELATLREDYRCRIAGMLKAIAVADRSRANRESLANLFDSLLTMSSGDLICAYRKTAACFRDHFPGSFSLQTK